MSETMKSQNAFEAWMASSNYPETADIALAKLPDGNYRSQLTFAAWQGWQGGYRESASELSRLQQRNAELERGIADEREACAKVAAGWKSSLRPGSPERHFGHREAAREIAQAIRARLSQPPEKGTG